MDEKKGDRIYYKGYIVDEDKIKPRDPYPERGTERYAHAFNFITDETKKGYPLKLIISGGSIGELMLVKAQGSKEEVDATPTSPLEGPGKDLFKQVTIGGCFSASAEPVSMYFCLSIGRSSNPVLQCTRSNMVVFAFGFLQCRA